MAASLVALLLGGLVHALEGGVLLDVAGLRHGGLFCEYVLTRLF
jgi:hypothetical protein